MDSIEKMRFCVDFNRITLSLQLNVGSVTANFNLNKNAVHSFHKFLK